MLQTPTVTSQKMPVDESGTIMSSTDRLDVPASKCLISDPLECIFGEGILATEYAFQKRTVSGCLYTAEGQKIALSERHGATGGKNIETRNPDSIVPDARAAAVPGRSVYLGHYMGHHYGHFLLESLSATWALEEVGKVDRIVFHPFEFGTQMPDFARHLLSATGADPERIELIGKPCRFERIVIPQRLLKLNHSAHIRLRSVYSRIRGRFEGDTGSSRIYLSRSHLPPTRWRIANEQAVEEVFRRRGFAVIHAEELTLPEQVALYAGCSVLAGVAGSALHNIVFCRPGTKLVYICDSRTRFNVLGTQVICNELAQAECHVVPFDADASQNAVSAETVEDVLSRAL